MFSRSSLWVSLTKFRRWRRGASAVEYALVLVVVGALIITAVSYIGTTLSRISCGMASMLGTIAASATLSDGGSANPCNTGPDTCTGAAVGSICSRLNANGGYDTVVVAQANTLYAWPSDEASLLKWSPSNADVLTDYGTPAAANTDTAGMSETNTLLGLGGSYPAAAACRAHGPDWYLPAMGELHVMQTAAGQNGVGSLSFNSNNGMNAGDYWATSEYTTNNAWNGYYSGGWQSGETPKSGSHSVRCVRK